MEIFGPDAQVHDIKQIDPILIKEIQEETKADYRNNFDFDSLFVLEGEDIGLAKYLPWVQVGLSVLIFIYLAIKL